MRTFSTMFATPGLITNTLSILALPSFWCVQLFPMSMLSFSANYWSRSWASQVLVQPWTPRQLMNAPKASYMTCAMHGMWFHNAGHLKLEGSSVDCSSRDIDKYEESLSVAIPSTWPSVSSKLSCTAFKSTASLETVCCPFTWHR